VRAPPPLGLIVLWQLVNEPMHVYRMQKLFEAEGKQRIVNVRSRASLYQAFERLERANPRPARARPAGPSGRILHQPLVAPDGGDHRDLLAYGRGAVPARLNAKRSRTRGQPRVRARSSRPGRHRR
jgi:hypothetical protein